MMLKAIDLCDYMKQETQEYSRNGHRQRMRTAYLENGAEHMADHQLLELYLSLVIPRRDVKELAYRLMNTFGSLEGIFNAEPWALQAVEGVGENTAVLLSLFKAICNRIEYNKLHRISEIISTEDALDYCRRVLADERDEKIAIVSLSSSLKVINCSIVATGGSDFVGVSAKDIMSVVLRDNASRIILAHNHPNSEAYPSAADLNFTLGVLQMLRSIGVKFVDHIIVGDGDVVSMRCMEDSKGYFD
ncbi:MAG: RadC family protein [Eubacterium sp.]